MENHLIEICNVAKQATAYNSETKETLIHVLKNNGGEHFTTIDDMVFTTNEHGILEGIGFTDTGDFKIWNNRKFGTFKK